MKPQSAHAPKTAVLLRHIGIGDLIWHLPYIRALAQRSCNGKITVIAAPSTLADQILSCEDCVEQVMLYDRNRRRGEGKGVHGGFSGMIAFASQLRRKRFERIYLFSSRYHHGILAWLAGIPVRSGYGRGLFQRLFLNAGPYIGSYTGPSVSQYEDAVSFALAHGIVGGHVVPKLSLPEVNRDAGRDALAALPRPRVALAVGSSQLGKHWGDVNYRRLVDRLRESGLSVAVIAGPSQRDRAESISSGMAGERHPRVVNMTDRSILDVAGILAASDICVGNDTGILNMAAAVNTPCLCILGHRPLLTHDPLIECIEAANLSRIDPEMVMAALQHRLVLAKGVPADTDQELPGHKSAVASMPRDEVFVGTRLERVRGQIRRAARCHCARSPGAQDAAV